MITREQSIKFKANSAYVRNSSHMTLKEAEAYNTGYIDGAHEADSSLLNTFEVWIKHIAKNGTLTFHERGFQNEEEAIENFKSWLGYDSNQKKTRMDSKSK